MARSVIPNPAANSGAANQADGFSVLEALLGVAILGIVLGSMALLASRQAGLTRDVDSLSLVENAVAADLGWLKTYAKLWRMTSGPYNLTCTQAGFGSNCAGTANDFTFASTQTVYAPDPNSDTCPDPSASPVVANTALASAFVTAAGSTDSSTLAPARPYAVATGTTTLLNSATDTSTPPLPSGTTLTRTITLGTNLVYVSYSFTGTNAAPYQFIRQAALRPEASAWCP